MRKRIKRWLMRQLLRDLELKRCAWIGPGQLDVYAWGKWSGILKALDENSPYAEKTFREITRWYFFGLRYLRGYIFAATGKMR